MFCPSDTVENLLNHIAMEFGHDTDLYNLHVKYLKKYGLPYVGRNRATYLATKHVVKLPVSPDGFADNDWEGSLISEEGKSLARTRMVNVHGSIPVIFMERVEYVSFDVIQSDYPPEAVETYMASDCGQVGLSKRGNIVCYDYGMR